MKKFMGKSLATAVIAFMGYASAANATINFGVQGLTTNATADVSFSYSSLGDTSAILTIGIENTSAVGGRIVAFAFNIPASMSVTAIGGAGVGVNPVELASLSAAVVPEIGGTQNGWYGFMEPDDINAPNGAGDFDYGVMNSPFKEQFITDGIGDGPRILNDDNGNDSTTFIMLVTGTGLDDLTNLGFEHLFLDELSVDGSAGAFNFGVRFQGLRQPPNGRDLAVVPVPGAAALGFLGLGLAGWVRRRMA